MSSGSTDRGLIQIQPEFLPVVMKLQRRWVGWLLVEAPDGRRIKKPFNIHTGSVDGQEAARADWHEVDKAYRAGVISGYGYSLGERGSNDNVIFIDLDNAVAVDDLEGGPIFSVKPWALEILERFEDCYIELSPSGTGIHIIVRGQVPHSLSRVKNHEGVEIYDSGRYLAMTGYLPDVWRSSQPSELVEKQESIDWLYAKTEAAIRETRRNTPPPAITYDGAERDDFDYATKMLMDGWLDNRVEDYDVWLEVGFALHERFGAAGIDLWDAWSRRGMNYTEGCCHHKARSFGAGSSRGKARFGSFVNWVRAAGGPPQRAPAAPKARMVPPSGVTIHNGATAEDSVESSMSSAEEQPEDRTVPTLSLEIDYPNDPGQMAAFLKRYFAHYQQRVVFWSGELWQFGGSCYRNVTGDAKFEAEVTRIMMDVYAANPKYNKDGEITGYHHFSCSGLTNVIQCLGAISGVDGPAEDAGYWLDESKRPDWWPEDSAWAVCCANGLLSLKTGDFIASTQDYFGTTTNGVEWTGHDTPAPEFKAWLRKVQPDALGRQQAEWLLGYTLHGDNPLSKLFFLYGKTRTGKGSMIRFMERLVGLDNSTPTCMKELGSDFGLESIIGKSLLTYPDYRPTDKTGADLGQATQALLSLTGRDRQNIRRKNQKTIAATLRAKFVMGSNDVVALPDASGTIANRVHALSFDHSFLATEAPDLDLQIWNREASGILAAAVSYHADFVANGFTFTSTEASRETSEAVRLSATPVIGYLEECFVSGSGGLVPFKESFQAFLRYLDAKNGQKRGWTENKLRCELRSNSVKTVKVGGVGHQIEYIPDRYLSELGERLLQEWKATEQHRVNQQELTQVNLDNARRNQGRFG